MYDEEFKSGFLTSEINSNDVRSYYKWLFSITEKYETKLDKDFCEFTKDEMSSFYLENSKMLKSSNLTFRGNIKRYLLYCSRNGRAVQCDFDTDVGNIDSSSEIMRNKMAFGPEHLDKYMDIVFGKTSEMTDGIRFKCLYWMAFMGIKFKNAICITGENVDLQNGIIRENGFEHKMFNESLEVFSLAITLKEFVVINPRSNGKTYTIPRHDCDLILRGSRNRLSGEDKTDGATDGIKQAANRKLTAALKRGLVTTRLTYDSVMKSGLFYRTYLREASGIKPAFRLLLKSDAALSGKQSISDYDKMNYDADYAAWKKAYQMYLTDSYI